MRHLVLFITLCILTGCATTPHAQPSDINGTITFSVHAADDRPLPDVRVLLVTREASLRQIGVTDVEGRVSVERRTLIEERATAVLFCHKLFFCGAARMQEDEVLRYSEFFIELAPEAFR